MADGMPWGEMMRAAVRLGIPPAAFWRLSLREWRWLTGTAGGEAVSLGRAGLDALMRHYPDDPGTEKADG